MYGAPGVGNPRCRAGAGRDGAGIKKAGQARRHDQVMLPVIRMPGRSAERAAPPGRKKMSYFFLAFLAFFAFFAFLAIVSSQGFQWMDTRDTRGMLGGGPALQHPRS